MINNAMELNVTLHQLTRYADMLEALHLDAEAKNDWTLFPLVSKGYFHKIRELNTEIRDYLQEHPETAEREQETAHRFQYSLDDRTSPSQIPGQEASKISFHPKVQKEETGPPYDRS